jgi:hypothetical protein
VIFRYVAAFLKETVLAELVERETADTLDLTNGVSVEIQTCSFKSIRGYSIAACLADEAAFWSVDGVSPDVEVLGAVRPAMLTFPNAMMLVASSPYAVSVPAIRRENRFLRTIHAGAANPGRTQWSPVILKIL